MAKRGRYGPRGKFKLKLKKKTIYTLFGFGNIGLGALMILSFFGSGSSFDYINSLIRGYFGPFSFFLGFVFLLFGFLFFNLKFVLSKVNVSIGFAVIYASAVILFRSGYLGGFLFQNIADVITPPGTFLIALAGLFIGTIVMFDTSVAEILAGIGAAIKVFGKIIPVGFFKKKNEPILNMNKQMIIKGEGLKNGPAINSATIKKDDSLISEKLVSNTLSSGLIWEYPPLDLLSETEGEKADRGDPNKIAAKIEETLGSFGITAKVVEVNLGPAVTQYAVQIALGTKVSKITSLANNLALATEAPTGQIRIEAPIPEETSSESRFLTGLWKS